MALLAAARQKAEWLRVGVLAATVVQPHTRQPIDPIQVIPPQYRPVLVEPEKSEAQKAAESKRAWRLLDRVWGKGKRKRRKT